MGPRSGPERWSGEGASSPLRRTRERITWESGAEAEEPETSMEAPRSIRMRPEEETKVETGGTGVPL